MVNSGDSCDIVDRDGDAAATSGAGGGKFKLFNRHGSIHQFMGGGKTADVLLWKRRRVSFGVVVVSTVAWLMFERSGLPFLSVCSDVLLLLIMLMLIRTNYAAYRNDQLETSLKLEFSEEMVNNAAASFRVKINHLLLMVHDVTVGKDFIMIFQVLICLWLLSAIGSYFSFFTLAYIGILFSITVPALYSRYEERVDRYCGTIQKKVSQPYRVIVTKFQK